MFNKLCYCEERNGYVRLGAPGNLVSIQGGHALATRLPRYAMTYFLNN
jgi:hypothetical protein